MDLTTICAEVRQYLKACPRPRRELAAALGVSHSWLQQFLHGTINNPTICRLNHLQRWVKNDRRKAA